MEREKSMESIKRNCNIDFIDKIIGKSSGLLIWVFI